MPGPTLSRYRSEKNVMDLPKLDRRLVPVGVPSRSYITKDGDTLKTLAWKFLGNAQYYWVLAEVNDLMSSKYIFGRLDSNMSLTIPGIEILRYV